MPHSLRERQRVATFCGIHVRCQERPRPSSRPLRWSGMMRAVKIVGQILSLLVTSAVVGAGMGFWLGEITARKWPRFAQPTFAEGASGFGAPVALVVGSVLYLLLRRRVSFGEFSAIVTCTAVVGTFAALPGWELFVPIASVFAAVCAAVTVKALQEDR